MTRDTCSVQREVHTHTHAYMTERPISLDGAGGVSPGAPNAHAEGGDPVGDVVAIIGPRITLESSHGGGCTYCDKTSLGD